MKRYNYEPGNITRYDLLYGQIEDTQTYALVCLNGAHKADGGSMTFHANDRPTPDDVWDRMRLRYEGDAVALAEFIEAHYPSRISSPEGRKC